MDLAKIRQKARQEQQGEGQAEQPAVLQARAPAEQPVSTVCDSPSHVLSQPVAPEMLVQPEQPIRSVHHSLQLQRAFIRNPIDALLSGREASGCDEEHIQAIDAEAAAEQEDYLEYLCFRVSIETYGINIMDIKEIIKPREVTEIPRAPVFVSGVISLRGIIIPIIDMRERLGLGRETPTGKERVVVVRYGESFSGLLVDEIIQVVKVSKDCLEPAPAILDGIDREFVSGIGRSEGRMIILLNLEKISDIDLY